MYVGTMFGFFSHSCILHHCQKEIYSLYKSNMAENPQKQTAWMDMSSRPVPPNYTKPYSFINLPNLSPLTYIVALYLNAGIRDLEL